MIRVLFVCLGNICRSPMAEAVFSHLVREAGLQREIEADSAGTGNWHVGEPPHHGTRRILRAQGIAYSGTARQITRNDLTRFDYIVTMDDENLAAVRELTTPRSTAHIAPLLTFSSDAQAQSVREVPDPYFGGGFDEVYHLIHAGCSGLLEHIRRRNRL